MCLLFNPRAVVLFRYIFLSIFLQKRKEKGRINLENVRCVEVALLTTEEVSNTGATYSYPFQIGYSEGGNEYILYLIALNETDRADWILALRNGKFSYFLPLHIIISYSIQRLLTSQKNARLFFIVK